MKISHGKAVGQGAAMSMGPLGKGGKAVMKPKTSGHLDPWHMREDAVGSEKGHRGPYTTAGKGHSKTK